MKRGRENDACSLCCQNDPTTFCSCLEPPLLLCVSCVGTHYSKERTKVHELSPIEIIEFATIPGYKENLRKRLNRQNEGVQTLRDNLKEIEAWRGKIREEANFMIVQLVKFRSTVEREMSDLLQEANKDIEAGIQEFNDKFYEAQPLLISPIAKALWTYESGPIRLLSCNTDFSDIRKSFEGFLFSIDVHLQTTAANYKPKGLISVAADIKTHRKVNIYQPSTQDFSTPQSTAALTKFGEFHLTKAAVRTIQRGPIADTKGVYTGEWNQHTQQHGFGKYQAKSGDIYTGEWRNGLFHGKCRHILACGSVFEGKYCVGKQLGYGTYIWPNGNTYQGEFAENDQQGVGLLAYGDKSSLVHRYIGEFSKGKFDGLGTEFSRAGPLYAGQFKAGKRHGNGLLFDHGKCSLASFVDGQQL